MRQHPALVINHKLLKENMRTVIGWCADAGIGVTGVIKVLNGRPEEMLGYEEAGAVMIASSRLEQLARAREAGVKVPLLMIRVPMLSELGEMLDICEYSLESELRTLNEINERAAAKGITHKVILMADLGDLREGFIDCDELVAVAEHVEKELPAVYLAGIGTNLGCYGSVVPTEQNMTQLAELAERIESVIGRKLDIISGGATSSMLPVFDKVMPGRINNLRIGEMVHVGALDGTVTCFGRKEPATLSDEAITLEAEVIEVKTKPTHPIGELGINAFGQRPTYVDRGNRKRALLAVGAADYGDIGDIIPQLDGAEVIGASGDHTILDIEDCTENIRVGDTVKFKLKYSAILRLSGSENVKKYDI